MDGALGAAGNDRSGYRHGKARRRRRANRGLELLGGGSILTGLVLGAIGAFVIERKFTEASAFAAAGAVLTFLRFMHGESIGVAVTPTVAVAYAIVAGFLYALVRYPEFISVEIAPPEGGDRTSG